MHLGMSGDFRVEHGGAAQPLDRHDHVILRLASGAVVTFNDPRRFGSMDLVPTDALAEHPVIGALGPEPLSASFTPAVLARACRGRKTTIKAALLDQRIVAGLGNIYVVEALHRAGLSPLRRASVIATATGAPRPVALRLVPAIKQVLAEAIERAGNASYRGGRFRVYDREGQRVPAAALHGDDPPPHPGRAIHVLLSRVPALSGAQARTTSYSTNSVPVFG